MKIFKKYILIFNIMIFLILFSIQKVESGSYINSAHGSSSYGVKRDIPELNDYSRGNCVHCHEMHASIGGKEPDPAGGSASVFTLFANNFDNASAYNRPATGSYNQSDDFCFYCHSNDTYQYGGINNYDYSATFGGADITVSNIMDAFNQLSYHNLYDIWDFARKNFSFFKDGSNPCVACHNPHIAKRSCGKPGISFDASQTAISKPSDHGNLWGDNATERMNIYATGYKYQAPYWNGSTNRYEPAGDTTWDGSNLPDYVSFCTDCHNPSYTIKSTTLGRDLKKIDWDNEKHGKGAADGSIEIKAPFSNSSIGQYVLSCTDCHEPHGAPNVMLIRREVNGGKLAGNITAFKTTSWAYLCSRCHNDNYYYIHHKAPDAPYPGPPPG